MILDLISQSVLDKVIENSEDSMPNKIKEKEESLQNTLNNRVRIPIMQINKVHEKSNDEYKHINVDYDGRVSEYKNEAQAPIPTETTPELDKAESTGYTISSIDVRTLLEGDEKPINVKEHMIINMMKKDINNFDSYQGLHVNTTEDNQKLTQDYEEHIIVEEKENEVPFEEPTLKDTSTEIGKYGIPVNIEKALSSTFDFDNTMVAIHQTREEFKNVSQQANMATKAANESEELLQKVSSEYSEAEKQLREKEKRSLEMEQKIISILNSEKDRISQQMHEKESLINDANKRKEQNDGKIVDFRSKINSAKEKENEIDEKLSRQEELLNTLVGFNINLDDYSLDSDDITTQKVA